MKSKSLSSYLEFAVASNFSFLRGASHAEELMLQAAHIGLDGIGLCDRNSVAGVVRAHTKAKEAGLRIAVGARLVFADGTPDILAYPQDRAGGSTIRLRSSIWSKRSGNPRMQSPFSARRLPSVSNRVSRPQPARSCG